MSVSSTRVRTCTDVRSAIFMSTVPPLTALRRRRDHDAGLDRLLDDRARDRRAHVGVVERDARVLDGDVGADDLRLGVRELELRLLVVGLRQRLRLEQRGCALHLRLRDLAPGLRRDERGLGLGQPIARRALVDLDEQAAGFDDVAGLGVDGRAPRPTLSTSLRRSTRARRRPRRRRSPECCASRPRPPRKRPGPPLRAPARRRPASRPESARRRLRILSEFALC